MKRAKLYALLGLLATAFCLISAVAEETPRGYVKGEGYQYYQIGTYPQGKNGETAPLLWRMLSVEDGHALLMTEYVIDAQQVIFVTDESVSKLHTYRRIGDFAQSDLCGWMNTTLLSAIMGESKVQSAMMNGEYGKLYLLTDEQMLRADYGFSAARYGVNPSRRAEATAYAVRKGVYRDVSGYSPYWVANVKAAEGYKLQIVGFNGHLSYGAYTRTDIGIRPAMMLDLNNLVVTAGNGSRTSPFQMALKTKDGDAVNPDAGETAAVTQATTTPDATIATTTTTATKAPAAEAGETVAAVKDDKIGNRMTLSLVGDCSIGDAYRLCKRATSLTSMIAEKGMGWPFARISDTLKADDLTAANLEVCLTGSTKPIEIAYPMIAPAANAEVLAQGGVDIVNTANNHCFDFGTQGYDDTLAALNGAGILHFGTAIRGGKAYSDLMAVADVKGIRFGFVGFSYPQLKTLETIGEKIKALRNENCDVVIVSLHWGRETFATPSVWQTEYAREVVDRGADVVWGHHPHVLQPIQFYKGKPIFFSTGNFVFSTMSDVDPSTGIFQLQYEKTDTGAALRKLTVLPCKTQTSGDYQPYPVTDKESKETVWKMLRSNKTYDGYQNLPESFLTTGYVTFDPNGNMMENTNE